MRNLTQASAVLAALLVASGALAVAAIGCGGDDTSDGGDAQSDGPTADNTTADQTSDRTTADVKPDHSHAEASSDAHRSDAASDADAASEDASDANRSDAASDAASDARSDAAPDAAPDADAAPISPALLAFPTQVNTAYCMRVAQCCGFDGGGGFDVAECVKDNVDVGGYFNVNLAQVDGGNILLDDASAGTCLSDISTFACETLSNPQWTNALHACVTAMQGQVGVNAGRCTSFWECSASSYCVMGDGGSSHCASLVSDGGACADLVNSTDCTYKGSGAPAEYCAPVGDGSTGQCEPNLGLSADCNYNQWCQSQICDPGTANTLNGECQTSTLWTDPGVPLGYCASYTLDAGTD